MKQTILLRAIGTLLLAALGAPSCGEVLSTKQISGSFGKLPVDISNALNAGNNVGDPNHPCRKFANTLDPTDRDLLRVQANQVVADALAAGTLQPGEYIGRAFTSDVIYTLVTQSASIKDAFESTICAADAALIDMIPWSGRCWAAVIIP